MAITPALESMEKQQSASRNGDLAEVKSNIILTKYCWMELRDF
jgi:hypothetical protein